MAPTLYQMPLSPPARAVRTLADALGLKLNTMDVDFASREHLKPEFLKLNPTHTVPVLVDEDGFVLWDSHAILTYLVEKYAPGSPFYPQDLKKRAIINQKLHFDSSTLFSRGVAITKNFFFLGETDIPKQKMEALKEAFGFVETFLQESEYIAGDEPTVADIAIYTSITTFAIILPITESAYPRTTAWIKKMEAYPYTALNKDGIEAVRSMYQKKMEELSMSNKNTK